MLDFSLNLSMRLFKLTSHSFSVEYSKEKRRKKIRKHTIYVGCAFSAAIVVVYRDVGVCHIYGFVSKVVYKYHEFISPICGVK